MNQIRFFATEAWDYLVRGRGTSLASVVALCAVFFLFGLVLLITFNVRRAAEGLEARKGLTVFLAPGVSEERAKELVNVLEGFGEIASVTFVSKDDALEDLERDLGDFPIGTALGDNPLPHSLLVEMDPAARSRDGAATALAHELGSYEEVDEVVYGEAWMESLEHNLRVVRIANLTVGILSAFAVVLVLLTTLRLLFVGRKDTLRILKVVGATDQFLRMPFLFLGALQCLLAGALALVSLEGARVFFEALFPGVVPLPVGARLTFLFGSAVLGCIASFVAIEPSLRKLEQDNDEVMR
ncbi:MAG: permease-like cell division protein FtsX [Candidatus Eisenbacteria bacterium]|uniref:Cell division protein FtsX n=1 Tax=Eiseniibacteriota bacterium TaxID=2212470 RepID=A0A956N8Y8_UNCEI|nr:permease-like cell division protein FtsX [Candidatus Eisenbacteria bacterium]MCB9462235.1 hypothetical protein [Candidatus Eisenbacteria bacterium]